MAFQTLASGISGGNQLSGQARTWYTRRFLDNLYPQLGVAAFGQVEDIPLRSGRTVSWSTFQKLGRAQTLDEGTDPTASNIVTGAIPADLVEYGELVTFSSHVELNTEDPFLTRLAEEMGQQHAQEVDLTCLTMLDATTNIVRPNNRAGDTTIAATDVIDVTSIREVVAGLKGNSVRPITSFISPSGDIGTVPGRPAYIAFISPLAEIDLKNISQFVSVEKYASLGGILPGETGMVDEVRFITTANMSTLLDADASDGAGSTGNIDVEHVIIIGAGAFGIADLSGRGMQFFARSASDIDSGNPAGRRGSFAWTDEWAHKLIHSERAYKIHCAASQGANA